MNPSLNIERDPSRKRRLILRFFIIPFYLGVFLYLCGSGIHADFNLADWQEGWRMIGAVTWLAVSALLIHQA